MLRRSQESILINIPTDVCTLLTNDSEIYVKGYGNLKLADLKDCSQCCSQDCVAQVTRVTVTIPESCECPYDWTMTLQAKQGDMGSIFGGPMQKVEVYSGLNPDGSTPTAAQCATNIVNAINASTNKYSMVTAALVSPGSPAGTQFDITEKDCSKTNGFDTFIDSGTAAITTPHTKAILDDVAMAKLFPINWGQQGSMHDYPVRGANYCAWHFHIRPAAPDQQNIDMDRAYVTSDREVTFYVNSSHADYAADWAAFMDGTGSNPNFNCALCAANES